MKHPKLTRRTFIKLSATAGLTASAGTLMSSCAGISSSQSAAYDAKGLPTAILGKTNVRIPRIALGLGSRFCGIASEAEAVQLLTFALDNGLYYWDTAWIYENTKLGITSEGRVGEVLKTRRKEVFLSTKVTSRVPDEAMRQIESSLKRLQVDQVDMLKIHDVQSDADVAKISEPGNLIDIVHKMKEQRVTRFIGFSGHTQANAMQVMAARGDFDSMLIAMNHWGQARDFQPRQETAIPAARAHGLGVILMKVVRPRETIKQLDPTDLVKYALSLKNADGIVLGIDGMAVLKSNLAILRGFTPLSEEKMRLLAGQLTPFYQHKNLPWMQPGYCDGLWA